MKDTEVLSRLDSTGIRREQDFVVPVNGQQKKLPYLVVRQKETIDGSDNGKVKIRRTEWLVALFTSNRAEELELVICEALSSVRKLEITRFPDGTPYQTNFEFKTN